MGRRTLIATAAIALITALAMTTATAARKGTGSSPVDTKATTEAKASGQEGPAYGDSTDQKVRDGAGEIRKEDTSLLRLFLKGGIFMWPLLLCAAIAMGITIERMLFYRKSKMNSPEFISDLTEAMRSGDLASVEDLCEKNGHSITRVLMKGLELKGHPHDQIDRALSTAGTLEVATFEKGLNILSALGNIAPMIGFLGTVSGMINAFSSIASADQVSPRLVAGGIEEALLTTAFGLIAAIPTLAVYNYFVHRVDLFVLDMERVSSDLLGKMTYSKKGRRK